jgi:LAO/AO transport system kinase
LRIITPPNATWSPPVVTISALQNKGLDALWGHIANHKKLMQNSGEWEARRRNQQIRWMWSLVEDRLMARLKADPATKTLIPTLEKDIGAGRTTPVMAMERLLAAFGMGDGT